MISVWYLCVHPCDTLIIQCLILYYNHFMRRRFSGTALQWYCSNSLRSVYEQLLLHVDIFSVNYLLKGAKEEGALHLLPACRVQYVWQTNLYASTKSVHTYSCLSVCLSVGPKVCLWVLKKSLLWLVEETEARLAPGCCTFAYKQLNVCTLSAQICSAWLRPFLLDVEAYWPTLVVLVYL